MPHDKAKLESFLDGAGPEDAQDARCVAFLPAALGGLGLQSATRGAVAAYWAGWADALPVIHARCPEFADVCVAALERPDEAAGCLGRACTARAMLLTEGWASCSTWSSLMEPGGARPRAPTEDEANLGDWPHGWQRRASQIRNLYYRDCVLLPALAPSRIPPPK